MKTKRIPWNKGKGKGWIDKRGYWWRYVTQDGRRRAKREHRIIMELHLGRILEPWEIVHHKDGNPANNAIGNLALTTHTKHTVGHHFGHCRPEAAKKAMAVFAQQREEIHHLRRAIATLEPQKSDLLEACKHTKDELIGQFDCGLLQNSDEPRYWQQLISVLEAAIAQAEGA